MSIRTFSSLYFFGSEFGAKNSRDKAAYITIESTKLLVLSHCATSNISDLSTAQKAIGVVTTQEEIDVDGNYNENDGVDSETSDVRRSNPFKVD